MQVLTNAKERSSSMDFGILPHLHAEIRDRFSLQNPPRDAWCHYVKSWVFVGFATLILKFWDIYHKWNHTFYPFHPFSPYTSGNAFVQTWGDANVWTKPNGIASSSKRASWSRSPIPNNLSEFFKEMYALHVCSPVTSMYASLDNGFESHILHFLAWKKPRNPWHGGAPPTKWSTPNSWKPSECNFTIYWWLHW